MNQQHRVEGLKSLRAERMSEDEMREVLALWAARQHQHPPSDLPTTADMAEGLDVPVDVARRLLHEVRERRREQERLEAAAREAARQETEAQAALAEARARLAEAEARRAEAEARKLRAGRLRGEAVSETEGHLSEAKQVGGTIGVIIAFFWIALAIVVVSVVVSGIFSAPGGNPFSRPSEPTCSMNGKEIPCSELPIHLR